MKSNVIKRCGSCGRFLSIDDFHWSNKKKGYKKFNCKKCHHNSIILRNEDNKEELKQYYKQYAKNNSEKLKKYYEQYIKVNYKKLKIYRKKYSKQYRKDNSEKRAILNIKYNGVKKSQTPDLTENEQNRVKRLYEIRNLLNHKSVDFHVDHIQPLSKGGLHHPDNLQILPIWLNLEKFNKWPLTESEQIKYEGFKL